MEWTPHARERIEARAISQYVSIHQIEAVLDRYDFPHGETHVVVKDLPEIVRIAGSTGNRIVLAVHRVGKGRPWVQTVMFRMRNQRNTRPLVKLYV